MKQGKIKYLLGIDGGGTKCNARLANLQRQTLGEGCAGSSNLAQLGEMALNAVLQAATQAFNSAEIAVEEMAYTALGLGISGAETSAGKQIIRQWQHPFVNIEFANDGSIACLGAHMGEPGSMLSVGTGIVGWENTAQHSHMRGGWGFPLSDIGSGAWLGLRALQETLKADDGIIAHSSLTQYLITEHQSARGISNWANSARSGQCAQYAKVVVEHYYQSDITAQRLIAEQVNEVEDFLNSMIKRKPARLSLLGGMADFLSPLLRPDIQQELSPPLGDALMGALLLISKKCGFSEST